MLLTVKNDVLHGLNLKLTGSEIKNIGLNIFSTYIATSSNLLKQLEMLELLILRTLLALISIQSFYRMN